MKTWSQAIRDGAVSSAVAEAAATAVSGRRCAHENTGTASVILRRISPVLCAVLYEKYFGRDADEKEIVPSLVGGVAIAGVACLIDDQLTPQSEKPLPGRSLLIFGFALAMRGLLAHDDRRKRRVPSGRLRNDVSSDFI
jgi:hypothetical protein